MSLKHRLPLFINGGLRNADGHVGIPSQHASLTLGRSKFRHIQAQRDDPLQRTIVINRNTAAEKLAPKMPPATRQQFIKHLGTDGGNEHIFDDQGWKFHLPAQRLVQGGA
jgi:hypothetical protein